MARRETTLPTARVESLILTVRGQKVILDSDLAALYGVTTSRLNEQVKRNAERFPVDFAFQLTPEESANLRSQFAISSSGPIRPQSAAAPEEDPVLRSQFATSKARPTRPQSVTAPSGEERLRSQFVISNSRGGRRYLPYAFTEHGAIMAANVLNSPQAVRMSVFVVRAFVKMRETLTQSRALAAQLAELERKLTERLDVHEDAILLILAEIQKLMTPPPGPDTPKPQIGFRIGESETPYRRRPRRTHV
jgi:hypothetical protein